MNNALAILDEVKYLIQPLKTSQPEYTRLIISDLERRIADIRTAIPQLNATIDTATPYDRAVLSCHETIASTENLVHEISLLKTEGAIIPESDIDRLVGMFAQLILYRKAITEHIQKRTNGSKGGTASTRLDMVDDVIGKLLAGKPGISPQSAWEWFGEQFHRMPADRLDDGEIGFVIEAGECRLYQGGVSSSIGFNTFYKNYYLPAKHNSTQASLLG